MWDRFIGFLTGLSEAGKTVSAKNAAKLKAIHDHSAAMLSMECAPGLTEASRARLEEAARSYSDTEQLLRNALQSMLSSGCSCYLCDTWDDAVVYRVYDEGDGPSRLYKRSYTIGEDNTVAFGDPIEVALTTSYEPVGSQAAAVSEAKTTPAATSAPLLQLREADAIPLVEAALREDGTVPIKIIAPGWGSSAYYPADVLKRDGPKLFKAGTHTYWNHPTLTESVERPERDLTYLAGALATDATWQDEGPDGPGLYADTFVKEAYRQDVGDLAPHIGMSISAAGYATEGEKDGRTGKILTGFLLDEHAPASVDYVTRAGAGGKIIALFESAGGRAAPISPPQENDMTLAELEQRLKALETENKTLREAADLRTAETARYREADVLRRVADVVREELAEPELLDMTRTRLAEQAVKNPPIAAGVLDEAKLRERVQDLVRHELAYLATVSGSGRITGMGGSPPPAQELSEADRQAQREAKFQAIGLSETAAKTAAKGRAR